MRAFSSHITRVRVSTKRKIEIKDSSFEVISTLIEYLYTNTLDNDDDLDVDLKGLFICASKYQINPLKIEVQSRIVETLSAQNVCKELLGYGHQFPSLRKKMLEMFGKEFRTISSTPGWNMCFRDFNGDPEIFAEMMVSIKHYQIPEPRPPSDAPPSNRVASRPSAVKVESSAFISAPSKTPTAPKWPMVPEFVPLPKSPPAAASFPISVFPPPTGPRPGTFG